jgi:PepSY-associated TM region
MGRALWRATVFVHRYLGVAVGLLMLVWFVSGIVMMYVGFPELAREDRLRILPPIAWQSCCSLAAQRFEDDQPIRSAEIETVAGEPVMFISPAGEPGRMASLAPTGPMLELGEPEARETAIAAASHLMRGASQSAVFDIVERDQWTVSGEFGQHRPMYRYSFDDPDGTVVYVSGTTGQLVLFTTASQRFWNWLGAIPHWLYPVILRQNGPLWSQVVIWSSILGGFLTVIGIVLGIMQFKRFPNGRMSPYRGWFYWHHIAGLIFGVLTLTWVISGTFSMNPWGFLEGGGGRGEAARLYGDAPRWSEVKASLAAIQASPPSDGIVELRTAPFAGKLFWLAAASDGTEMRLDASGKPAPTTIEDLGEAARRIAGEETILSQEMISDEDAYYFSHHEKVVLPAYRVVLNDAERMTYYLNPNTVSVMARVDAVSRERRWLFDGLHRIDFTASLRWRPVWDAVVILLLLGGIAVTGTGTYLAVLRIKRDLTFTRRAKPNPVPESAE